jgi:hypothetical protein
MDGEIADHAFEPFFTTKPKARAPDSGSPPSTGSSPRPAATIQLYSEPAWERRSRCTCRRRIGADPRRAAAAGTGPRGRRDRPAGRGRAERAPLSERILKGAGYEVLVTSNGQEALAICAQPDQQIDLC